MKNKHSRIEKKNRFRNMLSFTGAVLAVTVVTAGILAIFSYTSSQGGLRDSIRQADLNMLRARIEAYHTANAKYPSLSQLNDPAFIEKNLKGLNPKVLQDPRWSKKNTSCTVGGFAIIEDSANPSIGCYSYQVLPIGCDNVNGVDCSSYILTANLELGGRYRLTSRL